MPFPTFGNEKIIPSFWEREWEAGIPGNGQERVFPWIIVTSKGPDIRVASVAEVGVEVRARSRKNPAEHFNPAADPAAAFDHQLVFQPSKKIEFHRENFYIQLLEWYGLDHLKAECTELCLKSCTVQSNMFESVGNSRSKSKKAPLVLHPPDQGWDNWLWDCPMPTAGRPLEDIASTKRLIYHADSALQRIKSHFSCSQFRRHNFSPLWFHWLKNLVERGQPWHQPWYPAKQTLPSEACNVTR